MNNSRAIVVVVSILLFFLALAVKLFDIQVLKSEELKYYAERQQTGIEKIPAGRGLIYDCNNVLLVYNRNDISFYLDLRMAGKKTRREVAKKFSSVFGKTEKYYMKLMSGESKTICIEKKAPGEKALLLKNYKATGLFFREDPTRVYNYNKLASHVLGYVDNEYKGTSGIEEAFQKELRGTDGSMLVERDAIGDMLTVAEEETVPAQPGENLVLTINKTYQAILEEELHKGVDTFKAASATGIIMDPNSGEILALANVNDFDPNSYWQFDDNSRRNMAVTDVYEPGSTFKSISLAALFDQHLCKESDVIFAENGKYRYKNVPIKDSHSSGYLTVTSVMEQSSNIGMSKLADRIDGELYFKYVRGFGFGNFTSSGLPGEVKGTLKKPNEWTPITKAFMSFGYEVTVTPIQMITAYSALINGGILYQPQIIKRKIKNGAVTFNSEPRQVRTVISPETSDRMRKILKSVVENGSGKSAKISYMSVGGKTGTARQLVNGKYSADRHNSSFIGFFPAENPKIVCLILVNAPQIGHYGGLVAAPVFKNVAEGVIKSDPDIFNNPVIKNSEIHFEQKTAAVNKPETLKVEDKTVKLKKPVLTGKNKMPDLVNTSVRDAMHVLNQMGIRYKLSGSGRIIAQSINAGSPLVKGQVCTLTCEEITVTRTAVY